jgi:hypothetical protein
MRKLTGSQKKIITNWAKTQEVQNVSMENFPTELYEKLEQINDTEILYQNTERLIDDLRMDGVYKHTTLE